MQQKVNYSSKIKMKNMILTITVLILKQVLNKKNKDKFYDFISKANKYIIEKEIQIKNSLIMQRFIKDNIDKIKKRNKASNKKIETNQKLTDIWTSIINSYMNTNLNYGFNKLNNYIKLISEVKHELSIDSRISNNKVIIVILI